jgi:sortase A
MRIRIERTGWERTTMRVLRTLEYFFFALALLALGWYGFVALDRTVYQRYEEWAFDRELNGEPTGVGAFLKDQVRWARAGSQNEDQSPASDDRPSDEKPVEATPEPAPPQVGEQAKPAQKPAAAPAPRLVNGLIGRVEIPRVQVSAIVKEGVDLRTLRRAVGHVPGTAFPGQPGNVAIAAHRDTFFRGLRNIRTGDRIKFTTPQGIFLYEVESTRVVLPSNVEVLKASSEPVLTLITCYPFNFVGHAPKRFIVRARQVSAPARTLQGS